MAQLFSIHPDNPQPRLIRQAATIVRSGGLIVYPTDSCYALGCHLGDKTALERMRTIRGVGEGHQFTVVCRDLSEAGVYARFDDRQFRVLKSTTPGSYTFILHATREVPRRLQHARRKTIGLRIPDHKVVRALLSELGEPLLSTTLIMPGEKEALGDAQEIRGRLEHQVDLIIDSGLCGTEPTTVVNLTGETPVITRAGRGSVAPFALTA